VTTAEPWAEKERCLGEGFVTHFVRVSMRDLKRVRWG
jgi:hypothetical protein